ncbi:MAG: crossover junction endodeoxyribonuclease RuvC [Patescibacteria group bacterium]
MKILGIDPGYERLGVAIVEKSKNTNNQEILIYSDCLITSKNLTFSKRLLKLGTELEKIIKKYQPDCLALEDLFFAKNQKTAMAVASVRGMIIYLAEKNNLEISEHSPNTVKLTITGYGRADKAQMMQMLPKLIKINKAIKHDDEYDAIGLALTALARA